VGTNAAIAIQEGFGTLSRQLGNDEGYRSSRAGVSGCFTRWPRVLLNYFVCGGQQGFRDGEAEGVGRLEVEDQFGAGGPLHRCVGAPRNTPVKIVDKLNKEINAGLTDTKIKARLADMGATPLEGSPADFSKLIAEETEKWGKVIRAANIKAE
jgi:hypothetical protein